MICCKIIANLKTPGSDFNKLIEKLSIYGDFLIDGNYIYFADTEGEIQDKKIRSILKSAGYKDFFINIYDKDNEPVGETEDVIAWLANKIYKINYLTFEKENQEMLKNTLEGINKLDQEFESFVEKEKIKKTSDK